MTISSGVVSVTSVVLLSALIIVFGLKKRPGLSILPGLLFAVVIVWIRNEGVAAIGLQGGGDWKTTVGLAALFGVVIQLISSTLIEPASERLTGEPHDLSLLNKLRGDWKVLIQFLIAGWIMGGIIEEVVFRGFLLTEIARLFSFGGGGLVIALLWSSFLFGLSHWYQGRSGVIGTGIVGFFFGLIFLWSEYNLWLLILTHGFVDTIGLILIFLNGDLYLRRLLWNESTLSMPGEG